MLFPLSQVIEGILMRLNPCLYIILYKNIRSFERPASLSTLSDFTSFYEVIILLGSVLRLSTFFRAIGQIT